jgi:hypothetical protein
MTLDSLIILCGALVALLPFLGFPNSWDRVFLLILGICVVGLGIVLRRRASSRVKNRETHVVEHVPHQATTHEQE